MSLTLAAGMSSAVNAQSFPADRVIELSELNTPAGVAGLVINGIDRDDFSGRSISSVGDINADGIDDILIGAPNADTNGGFSGETYVIYGSNTGVVSTGGVIELSTLNAPGSADGLLINGIAFRHFSGNSVSAAGDINGDGIDDLLIGANGAEPNGNNSGQTYVIFGSNSGVVSTGGVIELSALNTADSATGLIINGINESDASGFSVSSAGDINGDGIDDLLIGAFFADPNGNNSGQTYVIFGSNAGVVSTGGVIELSALNTPGSAAGLVINGIDINDQSGISISNAGDINSDGIDDLLIGAFRAEPNGINSGETYVVFGSNRGVVSSGGVIELSALNTPGGTTGLVINGIDEGDLSGLSASNAGDINADGIDDLLIGATGADPNGLSSGETYVVFGSNTGVVSTGGVINLSDLNTPIGVSGLVINGIDLGDESGSSVSSADDINGDGIDDLLIGAAGADPNNSTSGETYVLFGSNLGVVSTGGVIELSSLNAPASPTGLIINGIGRFDQSGGSVSPAGDINGDGIGDLLVGADGASPNGNNSGETYVIFGLMDDVLFGDSFE